MNTNDIKNVKIDIKALKKDVKKESNFNIDKLLKAMDNEQNESILSYNKQEIQKIKNDVLQQLQLPRNQLIEYHNKLKTYRYVSDLADLKYGNFIRWISLKNPDRINLTNGSLIVDIKFLNEGVNILCKNYANRVFQIRFDECLIFQKLSDQEQILLDIMEHLQ
jgi:hypothetical protein